MYKVLVYQNLKIIAIVKGCIKITQFSIVNVKWNYINYRGIAIQNQVQTTINDTSYLNTNA